MSRDHDSLKTGAQYDLVTSSNQCTVSDGGRIIIGSVDGGARAQECVVFDRIAILILSTNQCTDTGTVPNGRIVGGRYDVNQ